MEDGIKCGYTATIVLVNGHKIHLDGFFKNADEAKEMWEATKHQLEQDGHFTLASGVTFYINPTTISYVRIGLSTIGGPTDNEIKKILKEEDL